MRHTIIGWACAPSEFYLRFVQVLAREKARVALCGFIGLPELDKSRRREEGAHFGKENFGPQ